jgi:DNA-binding FadR family transcriptional regulator
MAGLKRQSLVDQLADKLLDLIVDQQLDEGDNLPSTSELAERFDVSVIVVREAIAILVGRGVVERRQGKEPAIRRPGPEVLDALFRVRASQDGISTAEIMQCRSALEIQATALAAYSADEERRRAVLAPLIQKMRDAQGMDELVAADQKFHEGIVELSGNRALSLMISALRTALQNGVNENWLRWFTTRSSQSAEAAIHRHEVIAEAIIAGDRPAAIRAMADHFLEWQGHVDFGQVSEVGNHTDGILSLGTSTR